MKTIQTIIEQNGGLDRLKENGFYIKLNNPGYMALVIEYIGVGPRGLDCISVSHSYQQNGDTMRDPEMTFELFRKQAKLKMVKGHPEFRLVSEWLFSPVTFQQDNLGIFDELIWKQDGKLLTRPRALASAVSFMKTWDRNLKAQGFLECKNSVCQEVKS